MNKIWIWAGIVVVAAGCIYFLFIHQLPASPMAQNSSCLAQGEVASNETSTTGDSVVIRNSQTNAEISRFMLPSSTLLVGSPQPCSINIIEATNYSIDTFPAGQFESYELIPGAILDARQYAYDGISKKMVTIIDNSAKGAHSVTLKFDPSGQYVSAVSPNEGGFGVKVFDVESGNQLFVGGGNLWKDSPEETEWKSYSNGQEVLQLNLEDGNGGAQNEIISTQTWTDVPPEDKRAPAIYTPTLPATTTLGTTTIINFSFKGDPPITATSATMNGRPIISGQIITFDTVGTTTIIISATNTISNNSVFTKQVYVESPAPRLFTSSSSAQVGKFTVMTDCDVSGGETILNQIQIFQGDTLKQIISDQPGMQLTGSSDDKCSQPEARDINSDGYPDFSVVSNIGNQYVDSIYWLYNSSTDQFSCPNPKPSGKPWMACYLIEPL